jgi:hypothetical protein
VYRCSLDRPWMVRPLETNEKIQNSSEDRVPFI